MGSSVPSEDPFASNTEPTPGNEGGFGGEDKGSEKPFDDTPFDAGVEADEDESPEKYIQQLSGKLGQSLRSYTSDSGQPNFDLEKFAINSVLSATHTAEMDQEDQSDIISKVKSSGSNDKSNDDDGGNDGGNDGDFGGGEEDGGENIGDDSGISLDDIDMEESFKKNIGEGFPNINPELLSTQPTHIYNGIKIKIFPSTMANSDRYGQVVTYEALEGNSKGKWGTAIVKDLLPIGGMGEAHNPNANGKTVFGDATLGVKNGGMEENKYLNLENTEKNSIFVNNIKRMIRQTLTESPTVLPKTKPIVKPSQPRPTRKGKPFRIAPREIPNPQPKAMNENGDDGKEIKFISIASEKNIEQSFIADFSVGDLIFDDKEFKNVGLNESPKDGECGKEPWIYEYKTAPMGDERKVYGMFVTFQCDVNRGPSNNFMYLGAHQGEQPEIWEE